MLSARVPRGIHDGGETSVWTYIIGFAVLVAIIAVIINRRGSTGASRADDLTSTYRPHENKGGGFVGGGGGAGGAGDGG